MSIGRRARLWIALALLAVTARALLWRVATLRRAVNGAPPLRCRIHWHDDVTVHDNPENRRFSSHVCRCCGRVKDDWKGPAAAADTWAWTASSGQLH